MATPAQTLPRRTLVNTAAIFGGEVMSRLATFLMALLLARRFGAEALGQYGYALALASVLLLVPDFGLHLLTTRDLAAAPAQLPRTFWSLHWLKLPLVSGVLVFTLVFGKWAIRDEGRRLLLYVLVARVILQTFSQAYMAVFKAFERMQHIALVQSANALLVVSCAAIALGLNMGPPVVVSAFLVGQATETWLAWRILRGRFATGKIYGWDSHFLRGMILAAAPIGLTALLQALNVRLDVLVLSAFVPNRELGRFQAAEWFIIGTYLFASLLMSVLFPKISRLLRAPSRRGTVYIESLLKHSMIFTTLGSLAVWGGAPLLLRWLFGNTLTSAAGLLRILAPALPFVFLNTVLFHVFIAARRRRAYLGTLILSVTLGIGLGLLLAPRYGAAGSAVAALAREFVVSAVFLHFLKHEHLAPATGRTLLWVLLFTACLCFLVSGVTGALWRWGEWPAAWNLLVLTATLIFVGRPSRRELLLLADEES